MHRLVTVFFLIVIVVFCSIWQNVQIVKTGRVISIKEKVLDDLKLKNRMLEIKVANLKSLDRIEMISKKDLGLCRAKEFRVVYLNKSNLKNRVAEVPEVITNRMNIFARFFGGLESTVEARPSEIN